MILISSPLVYDRLKFLAQIVLPAVATFYITLASIWGLPASKEVSGTIIAIDALLGVILQLSTSAYRQSDQRYAGVVNVGEVDDETGSRNFGISLNDGLQAKDVEDSHEVILKVQNRSNPSKAEVRQKRKVAKAKAAQAPKAPAEIPEGVNPPEE